MACNIVMSICDDVLKTLNSVWALRKRFIMKTQGLVSA